MNDVDVTSLDRVGINVEDIVIAHTRLKDIITHTPLQRDDRLSDKYECDIFIKREDLQVVRSFKIRGALNYMKNLSQEELNKGVVCASAGNHAQGVAYSCKLLQTFGHIFMPSTTPRQKINQVKKHGEEFVEVVLIGDTFDDAYEHARKYCDEHNKLFVHPFDDEKVIAGQGTIAVEILNDAPFPIDFVIAGVGGGGLLAGVGTYFHSISPTTKIVGVEPSGAASLKTSLENGEVTTLKHIDKFVDGAAVATIGQITFNVLQNIINKVLVVPEGSVCTTILDLYNESAVIAEPAGALSIAVLEQISEEIKGKKVVCILTGGNNDIDRMQEIKERSMIHEKYQHYFIVNFPQRAGALREFLSDVLGPSDDVTRFEYTRKNNRESGPAIVGIELKYKEDYHSLVSRMNTLGFNFVEINKDENLFHLLV